MLCNECGKNKATIHITKLIKGKKVELHLCEECAKNNKHLEEHLVNSTLAFNQLLTGIVDDLNNEDEDDNVNENKVNKCSKCDTSYEDFKKIGRFGCEECYKVFNEKLKSLYKRLHGHDSHIGKIPERSNGKMKIEKQIQVLKKELEDVVRKEEFERAVVLRDEIKELSAIIEKEDM